MSLMLANPVRQITGLPDIQDGSVVVSNQAVEPWFIWRMALGGSPGSEESRVGGLAFEEA